MNNSFATCSQNRIGQLMVHEQHQTNVASKWLLLEPRSIHAGSEAANTSPEFELSLFQNSRKFSNKAKISMEFHYDKECVILPR